MVAFIPFTTYSQTFSVATARLILFAEGTFHNYEAMNDQCYSINMTKAHWELLA